jgi:pimeloyl-ACP methyl ester carboxylesterase
VEERCRSLHCWDPATMEAAMAGVLWRGYDPDAPLPCPVTVLRADPEVGAVFEPNDAERFTAANPEAEVVMVPGASHSIHATATLSPYLSELNLFLANL